MLDSLGNSWQIEKLWSNIFNIGRDWLKTTTKIQKKTFVFHELNLINLNAELIEKVNHDLNDIPLKNIYSVLVKLWISEVGKALDLTTSGRKIFKTHKYFTYLLILRFLLFE